MTITIYSETTGQILRIVSAPPGMDVSQIGPGELSIDGAWPDGNYYIDAGVPVEIPVKPSEHHVFDWLTKIWLDPRALDDHRTSASARIKSARDAVEFAPFSYAGNTFDGDATAQRRLSPLISISKSAIAAGQPFSYAWKTADNRMVELTAQDFVAMELAKVQQFGTAFMRAEGLLAEINAATTIEQLEAIQW